MEVLLQAVQYVLNLGSTVMLPIFIIILGLIFGMKFGKALVSGLMVGIGLAGLNLIVGSLMTTITPAVTYYTALGEGFTYAEIGWTAVAAASWAAPFAALVIPAGILINFLLLKLKLVKVMNVDIWNFVNFLMPGSMAYALSNSFLIGFLVSMVLCVITLFLGDAIADKWQEYFGLEGTTCTTFAQMSFCLPVAILVDKIFDAVPGLNKLHLDVDKLSDKIGIWGNPAVIGLLVGCLLGVLTKQTVAGVLSMGMGIALVMVLMPRMVSLLMEGLAPLGNAARDKMKDYFGADRKFVVGMDIALALGDPCAITSAVILVPVLILFALFIPAIKFFPTSCLSTIIYFAALPSMVHKGDLLRTIVTTALLELFFMLCASIFAPEATKMLVTLGVETGGITWTDASFGNNIAIPIIAFISRLF